MTSVTCTRGHLLVDAEVHDGAGERGQEVLEGWVRRSKYKPLSKTKNALNVDRDQKESSPHDV